MILTIRTTTGRENTVIDSISARVTSKKLPIKSLFHPEDLRGYVFIESETSEVVEEAIKGVPHMRGIVAKNVQLKELEKFLVPEKAEIKIEVGDIVEVTGGPFKGEKAKIIRADEAKGEVTIELLEAVIPIPITIPTTSVRIHEKKKV